MATSVSLRHLAEHPELLPRLQVWFESEWPSWYGLAGRGDAEQDLQAYSNRGSVPVGLVALRGSELCGIAALKREAFSSHPQLLPWVGAALVEPSLRGQGIGRQLIEGLEAEARVLGYRKVYCATGTATSLLERCHWQLIERVAHEGQQVSVYERALQ